MIVRPRPFPFLRVARLLTAATLLALAAGAALGQDDEEDEFVVPELRPGLVAEYRDEEGHDGVRVDVAVAFAWGDNPPDVRLAAGPFTVRWRGRLFVNSNGAHRFRAHAAGHVRLKLDGQVLIDGTRDRLGWLDAEPVELDYGYHPLQIDYTSAADGAALGLFWQGPQFRLEPISARYLFHDPADSPDERFEHGRQLSRALRCAACHAIPGEPAPLAAPALTNLAGNIERRWLTSWLADGAPAAAADRPSADAGTGLPAMFPRHMPRLGLSTADASAITEHLFSAAAAPADNSAAGQAAADNPAAGGDATQGGRSFHTLGCLACHKIGALGTDVPFGGGDLTRVAEKRPADFFARWLAEPERINARHRMPVFELSDEERGNLAAYLATLHGDPPKASAAGAGGDRSTSSEEAALARGRESLRSHRCSACHESPGEPTTSPAIPIRPASLDGGLLGCLGSAASTSHATDDALPRVRVPDYDLTDAEREALAEYLRTALAAPQTRTSLVDGRQALVERGCLSCHARENAVGIAPLLPDVVAADPELAPLLPALSPPSLSGVGDKLHDAALEAAIVRRGPSRRPWLRVRMPRFQLTDDEAATLVGHFIAEDRVPESAADDPPLEAPLEQDSPPPSAESELALRLGGSRLVTADGFGCVSCHQIGDVAPQPATLAARGPGLSLLSERVRRSWFERFVRNPARIAPRMEMPSIQLPARGVLAERLDDQLAAVWHVLNLPGFQPPPADAVRVVRVRNAPGEIERAAVLTDVLELDGQAFVKPLIIGLPNRHNVLFDLATNRLTAWWLGDTARQRTRGKSWYWEAGGTPLWPLVERGFTAGPEMELLIDGQPLATEAIGQFPTEFDAIEWIDGGVCFEHRLRFTPPSGEAVHVVVRQEFSAIADADADGRHGFSRRWEFAGVPRGAKLLLSFPVGEEFVVNGQASPRSSEPLGPFVVRLSMPRAESRVDGLARSVVSIAVPSSGSEERIVCEAEYLTSLQVDRFLNPPLEPFVPLAASLVVVPGYVATRLPLPASIMPTGFAWRGDGTLLFTSLKGQVHAARDSDGDGLEETLSDFADGLAAPYGLAAHGDDVDVINKYALLRLSDRDSDGQADRVETLSSGWGHTADYHDWAVGLERGAEGRYYIALPCQQDERDAAAAHLRGTALVLSPRAPTSDDPRPYGLKILCGGLRFPMGLARSREGALFATDNQGNYNPFNELNHLLPEARYGFVNRNEQRPGFAPPFESPAIELPHPWTRSVNGICFLETPDAVRAERGSAFGPFEGHLLGCEYDTRRLVRMSLQRVDDGYQGAVYPFSVEPPEGGEPLEGPIVCAVAPDGDVYVGNIRDSGWGGGANTGSLVRLRPTGDLPPGIAEVRARRDGFTIDFTAPVDAARAGLASNYALESYRKIATPDYGGPDVDRRAEEVRAVEVSANARRATLRLAEMRPGFVYELRVRRLAPAGTPFFPAEAHYTLRRAVE